MIRLGLHQDRLHGSPRRRPRDERPDRDNFVLRTFQQVTKNGIGGVLRETFQRSAQGGSTAIGGEMETDFKSGVLALMESGHAGVKDVEGFECGVGLGEEIVVFHDFCVVIVVVG